MSKGLDILANWSGLDSEKEMDNLIQKVPIQNSTDIQRFTSWKKNDGTKKGLVKLIPKKEGGED